MPYADLYQRKTVKIPSVLAVVIVAALSFFVTNFLLSDPQNTKAVKKNVISLDISNISSSKANVVWRTSEKELGVVLYGTSAERLSRIATDERDSPSARQKFFNHSVPLSNLQPSTQYFFSLTNEKELLSIDNKMVFNFKTPALDNRINSLKPAYGIVVSSAGTPEKNTLVILRHQGSIPLSTLSKSSGEWLMPLNGLLKAASLTLSTPALSSKVSINLYDERGNTSTITAPIQLVSPVSDSIKIGQNYSLPEDSLVLGTSVQTTSSASSGKNIGTDFKIAYPVEDSMIPVGNPLIKGVSSPLSNVAVTIYNSADTMIFSKQTIADSKGEWKISVSQPLAAGVYSLVAKNSLATDKALTREFTVMKSGERVLGEATGSATLTITPTTAPTVVVEPTEITPTLPSTGGSISYLMYSSAALIILGLGLMFVF